MPLFNITERQYYENEQVLISTGAAALPAITFDPMRIAHDPLRFPLKLTSDPTRIANDLLRFRLQHV